MQSEHLLGCANEEAQSIFDKPQYSNSIGFRLMHLTNDARFLNTLLQRLSKSEFIF
ncbi:protein of unknown function [Legionella micdadei]|uniref:Uncharacterized protein n=1 Tax=Legionella micdadei TaxID=451 RepID=A0A098GD71_LEGMI|nr:protein of unknown function [Legionella micdadei]